MKNKNPFNNIASIGEPLRDLVPKEIKDKVNEAIKVLKEFENICPQIKYR